MAKRWWWSVDGVLARSNGEVDVGEGGESHETKAKTWGVGMEAHGLAWRRSGGDGVGVSMVCSPGATAKLA